MESCSEFPEIIALGAKASAKTFRERLGYQSLLRNDFIREAGIVTSLACENCGDPHDAEIVFEGGEYGYFCPALGFVKVDRASVVALQPDFSIIVSGLAAALECRRRKSTPLQGSTWRIGTVSSSGGNIIVYFHPSLVSEKDVSNLPAALSREMSSPYRIVLTANGTLPIPSGKTALLTDIVELDMDGSSFSVIVDPGDIVEAPHKKLGGAPNKFKELLVPLIQSRKKSGTGLSGRNEEAKAILATLESRTDIVALPSLSTIKTYLSNLRSG